MRSLSTSPKTCGECVVAMNWHSLNVCVKRRSTVRCHWGCRCSLNLVDENNALALANWIVEAGIRDGQAAGDVEKHGKQPAFAVRELMETERFASFLNHKA